MQVPAGWLVDRFGVKRAYAAGFAFRSTGVVLVAGVLSYVLLISQRVEMTETIPAQ
jgi:MFS family permease